MKRFNRLTTISLIVLLALIAASCNPNGSIPGAPAVNTNKTSLTEVAEATGRTEEQVASNFAVVILFSADKKSGALSSITDMTVDFNEYYISIGNDRYWIWGTFSRSGNTGTTDAVIAFENDMLNDRKVFRITGKITGGPNKVMGTYTIAGKQYEIDINQGKYY